MHRRLLLATAMLPILAQSGCENEELTSLVTVVLQSALTALIPLLVSLMLGGTTM